MATKTHLLVFFSFAIMALSIADANLLPNPFPNPSPNPVIGLVSVNINGTLYCTINGGPGGNGTATPRFTNALVQLRCLDSDVLASAITDSTGMFVNNFRPSPITILRILKGNCQLRVATPLVQCNSTLPSNGRLVSTSLTLIEVGVGVGVGLTLYLGPAGFTLSEQN